MALPAGAKVHQWYRVIWNSQEYQMHRNYVVATTGSSGSDISDLTAINNYFTDFTTLGRPGLAYRASLPSNATIVESVTQEISPIRSIMVRATLTQAGTWGSAADQGNTAGVFSVRSDLGGRKEVANHHLGPVPNDAALNGAPTPSYLSALAVMANSLVLPISLVSPSILLGAIINHPGTAYSSITNYIVSNRLGTMRRRTLRIGI